VNSKTDERLDKLTQVVLAGRVHEFLEWASTIFEISICSLGEQNYVDMVTAVLDPGRTTIRGMAYSAYAEYMHLAPQGGVPRRAPKDLRSLFAYCIEGDGDAVDPLILDDNEGMWVKSQQEHVIVSLADKGREGGCWIPCCAASAFKRARGILSRT
jgi:NLI interacting factor-like phosphatase